MSPLGPQLTPAHYTTVAQDCHTDAISGAIQFAVTKFLATGSQVP
jgi:hypothetical protein